LASLSFAGQPLLDIDSEQIGKVPTLVVSNMIHFQALFGGCK
jgi:hypothetical protein